METIKNPKFKKYNLIYILELVLISVILLVFGILKLTGVMPSKQPRMMIFNWITMIGGLWVFVDLFWALFSKKRRKKICLLDKFLNLPIPLYLIPFDIYCLFINKEIDPKLFSIFVGAAFLYVFINYSFQAIYHYFKPLPSLVIAFEEEEKLKQIELEKAKEKVEEQEKNEAKEEEKNNEE